MIKKIHSKTEIMLETVQHLWNIISSPVSHSTMTEGS
jgi:hypothetical protein